MQRSVSRVWGWGVVPSAALLLSAVPLFAADKLPKDGAWARYYVVSKQGDGSERVMRTTVRFVGTVREKGETLRSIEFVDDVELDADGGKKTLKHIALKFLINEKHLRTASNPLQHFVRAWRGEVGKAAVEIEASQRFREIYDAYQGQKLLFLAGASRNAKATRSARSIDYQDGQLLIKSGRGGTYVTHYRPAAARIVLSWKSAYELWTHKDIPLGMAALKYRTVQSRTDAKGKVMEFGAETVEFTIEAWGTGAKTAFPDAK